MARKNNSFNEPSDDNQTPQPSRSDRFGQWSESIARAMGTPAFLVILTLFCAAWLLWNTYAPESWRFDSAAIGFTALTLILSLQASYAAPMLLLAQNRQDDRDRVQIAQDRRQAERNLADTEFMAREVVALRIALQDLPDRDWIRQELRTMLQELEQEREAQNTTADDDSTAAEPATEVLPDSTAEDQLVKPQEQTRAIKLEQDPLTGRIDIVRPEDS
nr:DUF1003 domain-containing protein [Canibacter zhoujuaniae]